MRLLPNHLRVQVVERTPIAFVRQGGTIGMADADGVLLDIPPDAPGNPNYSFPVVTGLKAEDTPESREQRMHLYAAFLKDLDSGGNKISAQLSEVDLSDPEDVKALLPSNNTETLVHFGTDHFLSRYDRFQEHIAEWRQQYPRLSSVDMRYERQVVLQMPPRDSTVPSAEDSKGAASLAAAAKTGATGLKTSAPEPKLAHAEAAATMPKLKPELKAAPVHVSKPVAPRRGSTRKERRRESTRPKRRRRLPSGWKQSGRGWRGGKPRVTQPGRTPRADRAADAAPHHGEYAAETFCTPIAAFRSSISTTHQRRPVSH